MNSAYLTNRDTAALMGISVKTLRKLRNEGRGPNYYVIDNLFRYRRADVAAYMRQQYIWNSGAPSPGRDGETDDFVPHTR